MKIFFDENSENITIENDDKLFPIGSLIAESDGDNVIVRYNDVNLYNLYVNYGEIQKEDGSTAGNNVTETVEYLNIEFNKGGAIEGDESFTGLDLTINVVDNRLKTGDVIIVFPTVNVVNEYLFATVVVNNNFTIVRNVVNTVAGATPNLPVKWKKLR